MYKDRKGRNDIKLGELLVAGNSYDALLLFHSCNSEISALFLSFL